MLIINTDEFVSATIRPMEVQVKQVTCEEGETWFINGVNKLVPKGNWIIWGDWGFGCSSDETFKRHYLLQSEKPEPRTTVMINSHF